MDRTQELAAGGGAGGEDSGKSKARAAGRARPCERLSMNQAKELVFHPEGPGESQEMFSVRGGRGGVGILWDKTRN